MLGIWEGGRTVKRLASCVERMGGRLTRFGLSPPPFVLFWSTLRETMVYSPAASLFVVPMDGRPDGRRSLERPLSAPRFWSDRAASGGGTGSCILACYACRNSPLDSISGFFFFLSYGYASFWLSCLSFVTFGPHVLFSPSLVVFRLACCFFFLSVFSGCIPPRPPSSLVKKLRQMAELHALDMDTENRDSLIFRMLEVGKQRLAYSLLERRGFSLRSTADVFRGRAFSA